MSSPETAELLATANVEGSPTQHLGMVIATDLDIADLQLRRQYRLNQLARYTGVAVLDTLNDIYDGADFPEDIAHLTSFQKFGRNDKYSYIGWSSPFLPSGELRYGLKPPEEIRLSITFSTRDIPGWRLARDIHLLALRELGGSAPHQIFNGMLQLPPFNMTPEMARVDSDVIDSHGGWSEDLGDLIITFHDERVDDRGRY